MGVLEQKVSTFLSRYLGGEYERVWAELVSLGPGVREQPVAADARDVARETMRRAGENIRRIVERLDRIGYRFGHRPGYEHLATPVVYSPPPPDIGEQMSRLEAAAGSLPLSLRAWFDVVGSVNLMGWHPDWDGNAFPDPLVVEGPEGWIFEYEDWLDAREQDPEWAGGFVLPIAPDYYHKANVSGGAPYGVELPCNAVDAPLVEEWHEVTFVEYLRICFHWGGFPGWERLDLGRLPGESLPEDSRPRAHLKYLSADLLPL